jgi:hypothetical protein
VKEMTTLYCKETNMNAFPAKLTAFAAAILMNSLIMGALGLLFQIQLHAQIS